MNQSLNTAFYKTLLESTNAIPWQIDWKTSRYTYVGPQIQELLGWSDDTWATVNDWAERMHPEDRERVVKNCIELSKNGIDHEADYRALKADGTYIWVREVVHVIRYKDETQSLIGFMFDISERKKKEEELAHSLKVQHQLELENTRLQQRIDLAHDLHDGLGGSLVRSIALVDQSKENLSNSQFLSMLKLLRDDLRQIIDTGSSSGTKIPETPIIWGAAIRYRFMQIFDELGIKSSWCFPQEWLAQPTTLECLTLLRVIEESLTNIIKHSHAQQVSINLFFNEERQLVLKIEDDGIGFNVDAVFHSGISVGLRSMKTRLERINAKMYISSQNGKTLIKVVK
ncbi:PAS domain-containing protein [Acinetobacter puyangensis]|uniref:sensor histidine kinase n=1 Tax=Acinetobacter puyangensis TaxID=1096779 RepID=UPI003A4E3385